ncbi:MAG: Crp/Fnr family transcriptional regulator [Bacteroidota bacterium]
MFIHPNNNFKGNFESDFKKEINALKSIGILKSFDKNDIVLREGSRSDFIFFVVNGAFRGFREIDGKEVTIGFSFEGDIDCCPLSYIQDLPSLDTIESLCESTILKVYKKDIQTKLPKDLNLEVFTNYMLSTYIETLVKRFMEFKAFTAEECYTRLLDRHPKHLHLVPHMYIAAYLGITKERLSRIRKKLQLT